MTSALIFCSVIERDGLVRLHKLNVRRRSTCGGAALTCEVVGFTSSTLHAGWRYACWRGRRSVSYGKLRSERHASIKFRFRSTGVPNHIELGLSPSTRDICLRICHGRCKSFGAEGGGRFIRSTCCSRTRELQTCKIRNRNLSVGDHHSRRILDTINSWIIVTAIDEPAGARSTIARPIVD